MQTFLGLLSEIPQMQSSWMKCQPSSTWCSPPFPQRLRRQQLPVSGVRPCSARASPAAALPLYCGVSFPFGGSRNSITEPACCSVCDITDLCISSEFIPVQPVKNLASSVRKWSKCSHPELEPQRWAPLAGQAPKSPGARWQKGGLGANSGWLKALCLAPADGSDSQVHLVVEELLCPHCGGSMEENGGCWHFTHPQWCFFGHVVFRFILSWKSLRFVAGVDALWFRDSKGEAA